MADVTKPAEPAEPTPLEEPRTETVTETAAEPVVVPAPIPATRHTSENEVVDRPATDEPPVETAVIEPASVPYETEVITPASAPEVIALAETTPPPHVAQEVIVVDAPVPPRKRGNRLAGLGLALLASIVLAALLAGVAILLQVLDGSAVDVAFLTEPLFYAPIALFFLATILIVAIVNTAPWWSYIVTSVLIGAAVYFGTAGIALLEAGVLQLTQSEANAVYFEALAQPLTIAAGLLAREVAIWTGAILGRRGRGVRARNVEDREAFEREQASLIPRA